MANKDPGQPSKSLIRRLWSLRRQMDGIYKDTYSTDPTNRDDLNKITDNIEDNVSKILTRNGTGDIPNIANLYAVAKLRNGINGGEYNQAVIDYFEDRSITDQLMNSYVENKWIIDLDKEIDVICKYMPKMSEALDALKDAVLTADNFDKEYLTFISPNKGPDEFSTFSEEIEGIKRQYNLHDKVELWYENASKYGEQFVYKVPYNRAISKYMNRKNMTKYNGGISPMTMVRHESVSLINEGSIPRNIVIDESISPTQLSSSLNTFGITNLNLEIRKDSLIDTVVTESMHMRDMVSIAESCSILNEAKVSDHTIPQDTFEMPKRKKNDESTSQEGIISSDEKEYRPDSFKVPGLLLKELERENIILLYIDDICLGYYYFEFLNRDGGAVFSNSIFQNNKTLGTFGAGSGARYQDQQNQDTAVEELLRYLSSAIVANLDDKFINNNAYLKKEIYSVLKYNDLFNSAMDVTTVRVTYLAPNDVEHIYFKQDPKTHRGISDVFPGMIAAKMWCCLYIANTIGILTRGQDKRVYYVKQNVEQNIAQTLLNVINQIKKQNFNIMQIENMNSILGITGKYNDYIIPVGPSGDAPISMEVMEGQNIDPQTELMDKLEEHAINPIIPIELVTARLQVDYATQITMSNTKFMRFVFKRQSKVEQHIGNIMTDIYNTEYPDESGIIVRCVLPSPIMLNINNLNQIIDLINTQAQNLSNIEYPNNEEENIELKRGLFIKNYVHYKLGNYLKQNELDIIKAKADLEYQSIRRNDTEQ